MSFTIVVYDVNTYILLIYKPTNGISHSTTELATDRALCRILYKSPIALTNKHKIDITYHNVEVTHKFVFVSPFILHGHKNFLQNFYK